MNNKENFGGDVDDIEEMSELPDDNSKFVYTSEEDNHSPESYHQSKTHYIFNTFLDENVSQPSGFKNNKPKEPEYVEHHDDDFYSSEEEGKYGSADKSLNNRNDNSFEVYTVEEPTKEIQAQQFSSNNESAQKPKNATQSNGMYTNNSSITYNYV